MAEALFPLILGPRRATRLPRDPDLRVIEHLPRPPLIQGGLNRDSQRRSHHLCSQCTNSSSVFAHHNQELPVCLSRQPDTPPGSSTSRSASAAGPCGALRIVDPIFFFVMSDRIVPWGRSSPVSRSNAMGWEAGTEDVSQRTEQYQSWALRDRLFHRPVHKLFACSELGHSR